LTHLRQINWGLCYSPVYTRFCFIQESRGCRDRDHMVDGFTTYTISAYQN